MPSDTLTIVGAPASQGPSQQVKPTQPLPFIPVKETRYYHCTRPYAQMGRNDGFIITFLSGIHETNSHHTIMYLDNEIAAGHPELFHATQEQIEAYLAAKDPKAYFKNQAKEELEDTLTKRLAAKLAEKMGENGAFTAQQLKEMLAEDVDIALAPALTDEQKIAGTSNSDLLAKMQSLRGNGVTLHGMSGTNASAI